jgi:hypothetical protein
LDSPLVFLVAKKLVFRHFFATRFSKGWLEAEADAGVKVIGG